MELSVLAMKVNAPAVEIEGGADAYASMWSAGLVCLVVVESASLVVVV